jgi:sugar lactone lactonase YvrE
MKPEIVLTFRAETELGECPVWDEQRQALFFLDCPAPALLRFDPASGACARWHLPGPAGSFCFDAEGRAILAAGDGLLRLDFARGGSTERLAALTLARDLRFNDGAVDPGGRFWVGTMHRSYREPAGGLWMCEADSLARPIFSGLRVPNGLAWSADGTRFYFSDSPRAMFVCDYDPAIGGVDAPYVFASAAAAPGWPDGSAIDSEGYLWNARWDGGGIARFAPDGRLDRFVPLPVSRPTSCAFGASDLGLLFVTSARLGLDAAARAAQPLAGALFALDVGVRGIGQRRFRG